MPWLPWMGDTQLRRKTKWKIKQPSEVSSESPVKLNIPLDLLLRGLNYDKDMVYLTGFIKLSEALKDRNRQLHSHRYCSGGTQRG